MDYAKEVAKAGLEIKAIKLRPDDPFTWASGYKMPIYKDNRMFLFDDRDRKLITDGFYDLASGLPFSVIAGTSTSGIPWGTLLANKFGCPFVYVRDKPKDHGLKNQIEGVDAESDLEGHAVILIEDLISTGGSSARAVQAIRDANGECDYCVSIFNYGLDKAMKIFRGEEAYDKKGGRLDSSCEVRSILTYETLLEVAKDIDYLDFNQVELLKEWRADSLGWGEKHGFPKVER